MWRRCWIWGVRFNGAAPMKARKHQPAGMLRGRFAGFNGAAPMKARKPFGGVGQWAVRELLQWGRADEGAETAS